MSEKSYSTTKHSDGSTAYKKEPTWSNGSKMIREKTYYKDGSTTKKTTYKK